MLRWGRRGVQLLHSPLLPLPTAGPPAPPHHHPGTAAYHTNQEYEEDYKTLGVPPTCDAATAREAFLRLAKTLHPDTGGSAADDAAFSNVEQSYRRLLGKFSSERHNSAALEGEYGLYYHQKKQQREQRERKERELVRQREQQQQSEENYTRGGFYTLKPLAPQHRQYLSHEGMGAGTPAQREKQFTLYRAQRAAENLIDYKVSELQREHPETAMVERDKMAARRMKTRYGIERVVEDLILESMARGDFDNLPGAGKPLAVQPHNPWLDAATHKLNEVLILNGYIPRWVQLQKETREERTALRKSLRRERMKLGSVPLTPEDEHAWQAVQTALAADVAALNKKVDAYNLVVPALSKQSPHFSLAAEAAKVLAQERPHDNGDTHKHSTTDVNKQVSNSSAANSNSVSSTPLSALLKMFKL